MKKAEDLIVADAVKGSWVHRYFPLSWWPYAQLARWERPVGWQLLLWPCLWSLMLVVNAAPTAALLRQLALFIPLFAVGAIAMRGAGCTYNDLVDQDIDNKVARTRSRPLPSGRVTRTQAKWFLAGQLFASAFVLVQLNRLSIVLGLFSLVLVVIYPFMKRITWWPQFFLGLAFSWGALMGWSAIGAGLGWPPVLLYAGSVLWVIGYDTLYALQDIEDDVLVGVKSTARLFGKSTGPALGLLYGGAMALFAAAFYAGEALWPAWLGLALGGLHLAWQVKTLDVANPAMCLRLFKANHHFAAIVFLGLCAALALNYAR